MTGIARSTRHALALVALLATAALALAGCLRLPESGETHRVDTTQGDDTGGYVVNASGPADGASPADIVNGFLLASADTRGSHEVAREYLTESFAPEWQPDAGVQILTGLPGVDVTDPGAVTASGEGDGTVDAAGVYHDGSGPVRQEYRLVQEDGQWRIARAPDGVTITRSSFELTFKAIRLAYLSPDGETLVPDVRWFQSGDQMATRVARAFLAGAVDPVRSGTRPLPTADLHLTVDSVAISGGTATVSLTGDYPSLSDDDQRDFKTLLERSLDQIDGVGRIEVTVNSLRLDASTRSTEELDFPSVSDGRMAVVDDDGARIVDEQSWMDRSGDSGLTDALRTLQGRQVGSIAVVSGRLAAGTGDGLLVAGGSGAAHLLAGRLQGPVTLDRTGRAWGIVDGALTWLAGDGSHATLALSAGVLAAAVSVDGARVAWAQQDGTGVTLHAAGIVRAADGTPQGLGATTDLGRIDGTLTGLAWQGDDQVAAASDADGGTVVIPALSGRAQRTTGGGVVTDLVGDPAGGALRGVVGGRVLQLGSGQWGDTGRAASALAWVWR